MQIGLEISKLKVLLVSIISVGLAGCASYYDDAYYSGGYDNNSSYSNYSSYDSYGGYDDYYRDDYDDGYDYYGGSSSYGYNSYEPPRISLSFRL